MRGWIKLHRKITDNWIWEDPEKLRAWLDILLLVNHEDKQIPINGHVVNVAKGQLLTSIVQLADRWTWSRNKVYRFFGTLNETGMCTTVGTSDGTLITVTNWAFYQFDGTSDGTAVGTSDGTQNETAVGTAVGTSDGTQTRNIKNDKNVKKKEEVNNINNPPIIPPSFFPDDPDLDAAFCEFVKMRKKIRKPMTTHAIDLAKRKLEKLSADAWGMMNKNLAIEILNQSVMNDWLSLYPLKDQTKNNRNIDWEKV